MILRMPCKNGMSKHTTGTFVDTNVHEDVIRSIRYYYILARIHRVAYMTINLGWKFVKQGFSTIFQSYFEVIGSASQFNVALQRNLELLARSSDYDSLTFIINLDNNHVEVFKLTVNKCFTIVNYDIFTFTVYSSR